MHYLKGQQRRNGVARQQEIEIVVSAGICRFAEDYIGCRPRHVSTHFLDDMLVVRLQGTLALAEQQFANGILSEPELIETTKPVLEAMIEEATGSKVVNLHHDINTFNGEEVIVFTLGSCWQKCLTRARCRAMTESSTLSASCFRSFPSR